MILRPHLRAWNRRVVLRRHQRGFFTLSPGITKPGEVPGVAGATPNPLDGDASYTSNTVLLHFNGSNGSTVFNDQIGNVWTANGNAQLSTSTVAFGSACLLLDGTGDYISATISNVVGTGDFTIRTKIRLASLASDGEIFCVSNASLGLGTFNIVFETKTTGALRGSIQNGSGSTNADISSASSLLAVNTYYDVAFVADGSTARLYIDGVQVASGSITGTRVQNQTACRIGHLSTESSIFRYFNGRIDDLQVTRGVCRYPNGTTFTPPAAQLPSISLAKFDSRVTTNSTDFAQGVATDGTHIWYSNSFNIYKYTKAGSLVTSRDVTGDAPTDKVQVNGMEIRGGRLFVSAAKFTGGVGTSWIVEYNPDSLAYVQHWSLPGDWFSEGLSWYGGYWWVIFHANKVVARFDAHFNLIATYPLSFSITGSSGGFGSGQGYDGIAWRGRYMYVNVHEIYNENYLDIYYWNGSGFTEIARQPHPTSIATQAMCFDPVEDGVMWFAERVYGGGNHSLAKVLLV